MPVNGGLAVFTAANGNPGIVPTTIPVDRAGSAGRVDAAAVGRWSSRPGPTRWSGWRDGSAGPARARPAIGSAAAPHRSCPARTRRGPRWPARGRCAAVIASADRPAGTVLLLPGYTGSKEDFAPILDPLAATGFRAVAVDLPGQHESEGSGRRGGVRPGTVGRGDRRRWSTTCANDGPVVLLGHSFGGLVAPGAVLAGARLTGLVLLYSGPCAFRFGQRYEALIAGEP